MSDKREYQLLVDENDKSVALLFLSKDLGVFYRDSHEWVPMDDPDDLPFDLEQLVEDESVDIDESFIDSWDRR
ncbi:hypothetical protein SEA_FORZA_79 [Gordonia phage Forza]|uniref:Uncharacterized protein n=1 Tax=Gordonia phage Forza TaxID=2571247 RepID=A0A650FAY7_9CAUD|nr:hypothetical protein PP303_gp079 [Gordonia phage Forza]QEM41548.1 hypothetical protein SEA_BOOPY_79 [Gordonia phage Boopy]QGT55072.1 hypothetical protein SEA_FORZA_79 [Gordonia phage Forza]UXE04222.1 hypothetical protein SEA_BLUENGOLD_78 [Gordonia phage BlueNGold]WBF03861.1 hypothetical protein SEA_MAREELIH_78 [Gordonia phage Mareelih]